RPAKVEHYFKWSSKGPAADDLVFVTGHPGTTNRLETYDKLRHRRDVTLPYTLARLRAMEAALLQFSERSPENARMVANDLHRVANARKAFAGQYQGLLDSALMREKKQSEVEFLLRPVLEDRFFGKPDEPKKPEKPSPVADAFKRIKEAQQKLAT